jgi:hypothetical protein
MSIEMVVVNNKVVNFESINGEMEKKASFKTKQEVIQSQPIRYEQQYSGGGVSPLHFCIALIPIKMS